MTATLALLPPIVVLAAVLGLRWSGLTAAALALAAALGLWAAAVYSTPTHQHLSHASADAALLTGVVAAMIVPGILFVEATRRMGSLIALQGVVSALRLPVAQLAILIAIGIGVTVESLTGMGVSLLVTVPLLLAIAQRRAAIGLALVGMSLMPWGALSISGLVGAKLAGLPIDVFALWVVGISGAVAATLPFLAIWFAGGVAPRDHAVAFAAAVTILAAIAVATRVVGIELAGVAGGLAVFALMAAFAERRDFGAALAAPALRPYLVLLVAVVVQKAAVIAVALVSIAPSMSTGRVSFNVLSSPGVALLLTVVLTCRRVIDRDLLTTTAQRVWRPVATVAVFLFMARVLVECGAVSALAKQLSGLGSSGGLVAVGVLGALAGFVTGSGNNGSALFMPVAAETGAALGMLPLFAALLNGAAGHTAMASLPVGAILLAALPDRTPADDRTVLKIGLGLAAIHLTIITAAALMWARYLG